jgi:hypothetical protein
VVKPARRHENHVSGGYLPPDQGRRGGFSPGHEITAQDMKDVHGFALTGGGSLLQS